MVLKDEIDKCLQCTIVGDSLVGKSTLVQKFSREGREKKLEYEHTIFENAAGKVQIGRKDVTLTVYDCSSEDEHLGIRSFAYQDTDVCILCYSVADRDSFENIRSKWSEEIRNLVGQKVPIVLVATQTDLRNTISLDNDIPVSIDEGEELANEIQACDFVECTSRCKEHVLNVFESAAREGLKFHRRSNSFLKRLFGR